MKCQYCSKTCKNDNSLRNHQRLCKENPDRQVAKVDKALAAATAKTEKCGHCYKMFSKGNIKKHVSSCKQNPVNQKACPVCTTMFTGSGVTCSYSCSNKHFAHIRNKDKRLGYQALCFRYHGKKCLVCGEDKIVAAHHVNEDHNDNRVENLVPLCPTHHQYLHSRYKDEVQPFIDKYVSEYSGCSVEVT